MNVLTVNLVFSTLVFWIAAKLYVFPRLHELQPRTVLLPILLLQSTRHLGLMFLAPGATYPGLASEFAYPAAFGDLLAAVLALVALWALVKNWGSARFLVRVSHWKALLISLTLLRWLNCTELRFSWGPRIGYRHSGFRRCW
jgi:hypothetical protein